MTGALIALDWGTSSLRAWLLGPDGEARDARAEPWGILRLPEGGFPAALARIAAGWPDDAPVLACGMVGSRQGWHEVAYLPTPSPADAIAAALAPVPWDGRAVLLVPGLVSGAGWDRPDVMRGEETQAIGALAALGGADATLVMPGTHGKWARLRDGAIAGFRTFMTGELHAVLLGHSILGRGVPDRAADPAIAEAAFRRGVAAGATFGALPLLFTARSLPLTGGLAAEAVPDYLSGLLLGDEIRAGLADDAAGGPIAIVGEGPVARRTADAFACLGHPPPACLGNTARPGLVRIARAAALLARPHDAIAPTSGPFA